MDSDVKKNIKFSVNFVILNIKNLKIANLIYNLTKKS